MKEKMPKQRFLEIYEHEADSVFRYCLFRISDESLAEDMTQDVFMRFWDSLTKGTEIKSDRAFIFMIARNIVIDHYRKKKTTSLDRMLEEDGEGMFLADRGMMREDFLNSSDARMVMDKISKLSASDQQMVYLRFVEDLKPNEIAEILHISPNAVSVRLIRMIDRLRDVSGFNEDIKNEN